MDFSVLSSLQLSCPETTALLSNPSLRVVYVPYGESSVLCDLSTGNPRPLVPVSFCRQAFDVLHNLSHPGVRPTRRLVSRAFVWSGLSKDVSDWARGCMHCHWSMVQQHVHSSVPHIPVPAKRLSHIHMDFIGPLPSSRGFTHLFTIMDRTSRWPEAVPLSSTFAEGCAKALISCWISRFGVPAKITSDCEAQFTSVSLPVSW